MSGGDLASLVGQAGPGGVVVDGGGQDRYDAQPSASLVQQPLEVAAMALPGDLPLHLDRRAIPRRQVPAQEPAIDLTQHHQRPA